MDKPEEFEFTERDKAFERQLTAAMKRVDAPERLSVLLRNIAAAEQPKAAKAPASNKIFTFRSLPKLWFSGAIAATLMIGIFGGSVLHEHREHQQAQVQAERQFEESQEITERALAHAREQIQRAGIAVDEQ